MPLELLDRARDAANPIGLVTCPKCRVTMRCVVAKPVEGEDALLEALYRARAATPRRGAGSVSNPPA